MVRVEEDAYMLLLCVGCVGSGSSELFTTDGAVVLPQPIRPQCASSCISTFCFSSH
jgi:hypothetical protein